jgi:four helix bundle protein
MERPAFTASGKPYDLHERLLLFACDVIAAVQFLHRRGPIARALSYQLLHASTSIGSNYEEADAASSHRDFLAKARISLKEAKESRFRLRVCRRCKLLDQTVDPLILESDELVRILGKIVHKGMARRRAQHAPSPD